MDTATHERVSLPHISYKAFSFPGDESALEAVKRIPGVHQLFHWLIDNVLEEYYKVDNLYNRLRVSEDSYPEVHRLVRECAAALDCPLPEVYLAYSPYYNAATYGVNSTFVTLNSFMVEDFSEDELRFIIGHELGHIKAGHVLYQSVGHFIVNFLPVLNQLVPFNIGALYLPLFAALSEWFRRAEFTADRAGLLCVQDEPAALSALSRFAGRLNRYPGGHDIETLVAQAGEVVEAQNRFARAFVFLNNIERDHPYPVLRVKELQGWAASGEYARIIGGDYARDRRGAHELGRRVKCPQCRRSVNGKLTACPDCGAPMDGSAGGFIRVVCKRCGVSQELGTKTCSGCGARV